MTKLLLDKIPAVGYFALTGAVTGLMLAVLLAQWTWLELRVNTGLVIPLGLLAGAIIGGVVKYVRPRWGLLSVMILAACSLGITRGDIDNMRIMLACLVREGLHADNMSITTADLGIIITIVVMLGLAVLINRRQCQLGGSV